MSTRNIQHCGVIIAGARCAGAATALLLARQGARVQLRWWGLLPAVARAGTPPVRSATFHLADADTTIPVKPKHGVEALYAPRGRVLDAILADAARRADAAWRRILARATPGLAERLDRRLELASA